MMANLGKELGSNYHFPGASFHFPGFTFFASAFGALFKFHLFLAGALDAFSNFVQNPWRSHYNRRVWLSGNRKSERSHGVRTNPMCMYLVSCLLL